MHIKESFNIKGLAGDKRLSGKIQINGAKNAALKAMAASILFDGEVILNNVPNTDDIHTMMEVLGKLGAKVKWEDTKENLISKSLIIDTSSISSVDIDCNLAKTMRASVVLTGPLLARFHKVAFPAPGGCVIGARPIDLFINGYEKMGATIVLDQTKHIYNMQSKGTLQSTDIVFEKISVGATETLMMTAVLANGRTVLRNCALEPEIANVANWLNSCGANIKGIGTSTMEIVGTNGKLLSPKTAYTTIPDRIEAGSYLILGALCAKDLVIENCRPDHLESVISLLKDSGVPITSTIYNNSSLGSIIIKNNNKPNSSFSHFDINTREYPGFPTDLQAQMVTYLTQVTGDSKVIETIFEGRFKYIEDLSNLGADIITVSPTEVLVKGPTEFQHSLALETDAFELNAHDIRAGFAIVLAALVGKGNYKVNNIHLIDRGYEKLEERLTAIGAEIKRVLN